MCGLVFSIYNIYIYIYICHSIVYSIFKYCQNTQGVTKEDADSAKSKLKMQTVRTKEAAEQRLVDKAAAAKKYDMPVEFAPLPKSSPKLPAPAAVVVPAAAVEPFAAGSGSSSSSNALMPFAAGSGSNHSANAGLHWLKEPNCKKLNLYVYFICLSISLYFRWGLQESAKP